MNNARIRSIVDRLAEIGEDDPGSSDFWKAIHAVIDEEEALITLIYGGFNILILVSSEERVAKAGGNSILSVTLSEYKRVIRLTHSGPPKTEVHRVFDQETAAIVYGEVMAELIAEET